MNNCADNSNLIIGCVAENTSKYLSQALRLIQSVRWFGGSMADADFIVCVIERVDPDYAVEFEKYNAKVRIVDRFSEKHPQSNKLKFLQLEDLQNYRHVLLLDCDTIVVQDPSHYLASDVFRAKIADGPTVSHGVFKELFNFFHLPMPEENYRCTVRGTPTIPYFNAGVLLFPKSAMQDLVPIWIKFNKQLIDHFELLGNSGDFCEQASLSLAIAATGIPFHAFADNMNFPIHHQNYITSLAEIDPIIIHCHSLINPSGYVKASLYSLVNNRIAQFNERLRKEIEKDFDNKIFWNNRYSENPELGSGVGSRGAYREYKRKLLKSLTELLNCRSVLDIGCGDMEVSSILPAPGYTGIDVSNIVIARNRELYPDRTFLCGNFLDLDPLPADMVLCIDVLIHINNYDFYKSFVNKLLKKTLDVGIVTGYENNPGYKGIIFFHEPLSETLKQAGVRKLCKLGSYRETDMWLFSKTNKDWQSICTLASRISNTLGM